MKIREFLKAIETKIDVDNISIENENCDLVDYEDMKEYLIRTRKFLSLIEVPYLLNMEMEMVITEYYAIPFIIIKLRNCRIFIDHPKLDCTVNIYNKDDLCFYGSFQVVSEKINLAKNFRHILL